MIKVTLKDIKDEQVKIEKSKIDEKDVWSKIYDECAEIKKIDAERTKLNRRLDKLSIKEEITDDNEILEIVKKLGSLGIERTALWKTLDKLRKQREVLLKLGSNLNTSLNKLKRKYWEEHGVQY